LALVLARSVEILRNDVDLGSQGEGSSLELEDNVGEGVDVAAIGVDGTDGGGQGVDGVGGANDQRRSGVNDAAAAGEETIAVTLVLSVHQNTIKAGLPVGLGRNRDVLQLARELGGINSTEENAGAFVTRSRIEVDREDWLLNKLLGDHVVEDWGDIISGNTGVSKTKNAVHGLIKKEISQLSCLSKDLVGNVDAQDASGIRVKDTRHGASTILNGDGLTVGLVGRRLGLVVHGLTSAAFAAARLTWNPQVGGTSIENNTEWLAGSSNGDVTNVFNIIIILEGINWVATKVLGSNTVGIFAGADGSPASLSFVGRALTARKGNMDDLGCRCNADDSSQDENNNLGIHL